MSSSAEHAFLALLDPDPYAAEQKYRALRSKLVFFFRHNNRSDPENLADETIERAMNKLGSGVELHAGIGAYCYGIARYVLQEDRRRPAGEELPAEIPDHRASNSSELTRTEQGILVKEFLDGLSDDERDLFTKYYAEDREELAREQQLSANALRIRVFRIRERLQETAKFRSLSTK